MAGVDHVRETVRILVVGDNLDVYREMLHDLADAGYEVASCASDAALECVRTDMPALVLLDADHSCGRCLPLARALRQDDASTLDDVFTVALSDSLLTSAEYAGDIVAYSAYVDGYVFFPLAPHAMRVLIQRFLQTRKTMVALRASEAHRRLSEARLRSRLAILNDPVTTIHDLLNRVLDEAIVLTDSRVGYIFFYSEDRRQFDLFAWSRSALDICTIPKPPKVYDLDATGLWGEVVRQRKAVIVNDYAADNVLKRGTPAGHVPLHRFLTIPIFRDEQIVAVAGVANREGVYTETDALELTLLMDSVWQRVDRMMAEEALLQERRLLRTVIDNLPDTIYAKDREARKTLANRADVASIGATSEAEVLGKTDLELFPVAVGADLMVDDLHVLESGEPLLNREELLIDTQGRRQWLLTSKYPLRDGAGKIVGLVGSGRDITEQKQSQVERQELLGQVEMQARQLQQILETVPQGVMLLDREGHVLLTNPTADTYLATLGAGSGERITRLGDRPLAELLLSSPTGLWHAVSVQDRVFEVIARPVTREAAVAHWVMLIKDATDEQQARRRLEQQERLAAVGQLAAGIAHDFNNIMAVIILYAQMVSQSKAVSGVDLDRLSTINEQARNATELIGQILDFSRRAALDRQPRDLRLLLEEQLRMLERTLPEHIKISLSLGPDICLVDIDVTRIQQVIFNLAINARDAMPAGGDLVVSVGRIVVSPDTPTPLAEMAYGDWVRVIISDTGMGIPADVLPHIFEPFYTTKVKGKGSGLGLAQVDGIIAQHGGYVDVKTQVGVGTTFTLYLPTAVPQPESASLPEGGELARGDGQIILIVEDNAALRAALVGLLENWHYHVLEAANGRQALKLLGPTGAAADLVLSDIVMPEMGGIALVQALRARGMTLPVILMTGHSDKQPWAELRGCDVAAFLTKPPDIGRLSRALAEALAED